MMSPTSGPGSRPPLLFVYIRTSDQCSTTSIMVRLLRSSGSSPKPEASSAFQHARMDQNLAFLGYNRGQTTFRELECIDNKTSLHIKCLLELQTARNTNEEIAV